MYTAETTVTEMLKRAAVGCALARALAAPETTELDGLHFGDELPEADALRELADAWRDVSLDELIDEHTRLFAGRCPVPPFETSYGDGRRISGRTHEMADIAGMYRAFGFTLPGDRPDHVVAELEFIAALLVQLAGAIAEGETEHESVTRDALGQFLEQHAGRWIGAFATAVEKEGGARDPRLGGSPYAVAATAAARFVAGECERFGVVPTAEAALPCDETEPDCMACPMAESTEPVCGEATTLDGVPIRNDGTQSLASLFGV